MVQCAAVGCLVLLLAILVGLLHGSRTLPPVITDHLHTAPAYDIEPIAAPIASGFLLKVLSTVLSRTVLENVLCRFLLNDNGAHRVRALASTITSPPLSFPISAGIRARDGGAATDTDEYLAAAASRAAAARTSPAAAARTDYGVAELHRMFLHGERTPSEQLALVLTKIAAAAVRTFSVLDAKGASAAAAASTARYAANQSLSVFDGVPVAFKDMMCVRGLPRIDVVAGGSLSSATLCESDDLIASRFRAAGSVILGVTIMTEHGVSPLGWNARWQAPVNPHDPSRYSGGSSGGSAVAVVSGFVPVAIGYDGGGSIRLPCALSGCVGLAATFGRIAFDGDDLMSTMIKAGPIGKRLHDVKLTYALLAPKSPDPLHFYNTIMAVPNPVMHGTPIAQQRIGVFSAWFEENTAHHGSVPDVDPALVATFQEALAQLTAAGATIVHVELPNLRTYHMAHGLRISAEFSQSLDAAYHRINKQPAEQQAGSPIPSDDLEPSTRIQVAIGNAVSAVDVISADKVRAHALAAWEGLFKKHELNTMVLPTVGLVAPVIGAAADLGVSDSGLSMQFTKHIFMSNLIGVPAITMPLRGAQLPLGLQVVGTHWSEAELFEVAETIEHMH